MPLPVSLCEVVEQLEMQCDVAHAYINRRTGELSSLTDDEAQLADDDQQDLDALPEWQRAVVVQAKEILASEDWLQLPSQYEIHEYRIMKSFCLSVLDSGHRGELLDAIQGRGAFRFFKSTADRLGLLDDWNKYREAEFARIAAEWLDRHGIAYVK